jgi:hypothetical protein
MHELHDRHVLGRCRCDERKRVSQLYSRVVLVRRRREQCGRVHGLPDQHVFRGVGVLVSAVPGERGVGGGQRVAGVLLLHERVCACDRLVHVQDLRSRHIQQSTRSHGVLELLAWLVLFELRSDRQRDVSRVCARTVVAGGQPELQLVPRKRNRWSRKWVASRLHLHRAPI